MNLQELKAQKASIEAQSAAVDKQIADLKATARAEAIVSIKASMAEFGITVADLLGKKAPAARKVAAKYRDPETGHTWTGRGLQPVWLKARVAEGRKLEEFKL